MKYPKLISFPQNWEDGMKLGAEHFQALEDSVEDFNRDARCIGLTALQGYGLIPFSELSFTNTQGSTPQNVKVTLTACQAVLPGGYRVEILPENFKDKMIPLTLPSIEFVPNAGVRYHLYLVIKTGRRMPSGIPQTRPIRHPFLAIDCVLECLPQEKIKGSLQTAPDRIKIGEWIDGKLVEGYIPPIFTLRGHPIAFKWYQYFQVQLDTIVRFGLEVINQYRQKDPARTQFCYSILQYVRGSQGYYSWVLPDKSPIYLFAFIGDLAGLTESQLDSLDRDFVRNHLKDGQINQLRPNIQALTKIASIPTEETASIMVFMQRFLEALLLTIRGMVIHNAPTPRSGERNISTG